MSPLQRSFRLRWRLLLVAATASLGAGCASSALDMAPPDAASSWQPPAAATAAPATDPALAAPSPVIDGSRRHGLADLIDIAQRNNPATRVTWEQARQAALAVGMVEATFLPVISANVIAGRQEVSQPLPVPVGGQTQGTVAIEGVSPQIALQWLVFDFGQRMALAEAARQNATAANFAFNAAHQKIIHDVTRGYFVYGAARSRIGIARQTLANSSAIAAAAEARMREGIGTSVEVAQARQQVAQARYGLVQAEGDERTAYQGLLAAMGVPPLTTIGVDETGGRRLPASIDAPSEEMIEAALARRPDVQASVATLRASRAGITAAEAEFMPKVFLGAVAATGSNGLSATGLPTIGQQASASGVMVGLTFPLFDGGLREARLKGAQSAAATSEATFRATRDAAAREIVVATDALRSSLAAYRAATALEQAAAITYDAALEAYSSGVGAITAATAADTGLLQARQARSDAHAASLLAAANLAFVLGAMTSAPRAAELVDEQQSIR